MRRTTPLVLALALFTACSQKPPAPPPLTGVDKSAMDLTANPCTDFYQYACGNWAAHNPIPADKPGWESFGVVDERNRNKLHEILDVAAKPDTTRDPMSAKVGDYYASCMDEAHIDQLGVSPIQSDLDRIAALKSKTDLAALVASLHLEGVPVMFGFGSDQDFKDANSMIAEIDQGGLGLPNRDYYTKTDADSIALRKKYVGHVQKMLTLLGDSDAAAAKEADTVLRIETALATASMTVEQHRQPGNVYHKMSPEQFQALAPAFQWSTYFTGVGTPVFASMNVTVPAFFTALNREIDSVSLDDWKTYLRWQVVHGDAAELSQPFVDADFDFFGKTLNGTPQLEVRWKRCVTSTDGELGEALGQLYVKDAFGGNSKQQMLAMVAQLEQAMAQDIQSLDWMTAATKQQALEKLKAITNKIGYPDKWRDYSSVVVKRDDYVGNVNRGNTFELHRQLNKIGQPIDRSEWGMTPPTVNAYYNPEWNEIVFPAGILQPPFYDNTRDPAMNYGAGGSVIGHEMTHGFDDEGSQFDLHGNLRNWWTEADKKAFDERTACIAHQYSLYSPIAGVHLNGRQTLGENTADNGGLRIAYQAMVNALGNLLDTNLDGLTRDQRFFVGFGQIWCETQRPERAKLLATVDVHSPGRFRANGAVSNFPAFAQAFHCGASDPMTAGPKACRVW